MFWFTRIGYTTLDLVPRMTDWCYAVNVPTLGEWLSKKRQTKKENSIKVKKVKKRDLVLMHHKEGHKNQVCALLAGCSERWVQRVVSKHKKALR